MLAFLLPVTLFLLFVAAWKRGERSRCEAFLRAAVVWLAYLIASTEVLSGLQSLSREALGCCWLVAGAVAAAAAWMPGRPVRGLFAGSFSWIGVGLVSFFALAVLAGTLCPPNTTDAMTYHVPRAVHWLQNGSVAPYPTHVTRQDVLPPGAEYVVLHLMALGDGDRFVFFAQALGWLLSVAAASGIAGALGAGESGQILAGLVAGSIPTAVLQAATAQNDLLSAGCAAAGVCLLLSGAKREDRWCLVFGGVAVGLAALVKPTAALCAAPAVTHAVMIALRRRVTTARPIALGILVALVLNAGFWVRNVRVFGDPYAWSLTGKLTGNHAMSPRLLLSNVVRNAALHMTLPLAPTRRALEGVISAGHRALGVDPSDPRTTWQGTEFHVPRPSLHEDLAGNPLHLVLAVCAGLAYVFRRTPWPLPSTYALAVALGALLLCAALSWQPWGARLHMPLFVLAAPAIASVFANRTRLRIGIEAVLFVGAVPFALCASSRPLIGSNSILASDRASDYFRNSPEREAPFRDAAQFLNQRGCRDVGLMLWENDWEYPLGALLGHGVHLEHVGVSNGTARTGRTTFAPCGVFHSQGAIPHGFAVVKRWEGYSVLEPSLTTFKTRSAPAVTQQ